ncbi:MAG: metal ABC transporter permease [Paramuribaculum sp.]|nr:metal ABC transporter permease [Paramuribaculum sp.]
MAELFEYTFFKNALAGLILISIASALIGTYIVTRRLVSISGGVTHACFGGLGLGYFLGISPVLTAGIFAVASSLGVELMSTRGRVREDSAIAVIWAIGMAIGILFVFLTPGYVPELNSFLFGNVLTIGKGDLWSFAIFLAILVLFFVIFYHKIISVAFDRDFSRVIGLPVRFISLSMTVLTAICIVLTIRLVGVMLLMSMLALPQLTAEYFCNRFGKMMVISALVSLACCVGGLMLAAVVDVPCSALIVLLMAAVYIVVALTFNIRRQINLQRIRRS